MDACPEVRAADSASEAAATAVRHLLGGLPWPQSAEDGRLRCIVALDQTLGPEAYRLLIEPATITMTAGDQAGAVYAAQTIPQLLPDDAWRAAPLAGNEPWTLKCARIEYRPALSWRGAHIDVARHFMPKREILALIDALAALKLNELHLHLTDDQGWRIESRVHPALHEVGSHRWRSPGEP